MKRDRKTHCKRGHEFTPENTVTDNKGNQQCRTCRRARSAADTRRRYNARVFRSPEERFWLKVVKHEGCWEWIGNKTANGYGQFAIDNKNTRANRFSYELHKGAIPEGYFVCHTCDNPSCANPEHLFLGTPKDNVVDMINKGRHSNKSKTHCIHGHEFTEANTYIVKGGNNRKCVQCNIIRAKARAKTRRVLSPSHCPQGHEYTKENTYVNPGKGTKSCRTCRRQRAAIRRTV